MNNQDERIAKMTFWFIYPYYVEKVEKKWKTIQELNKIITWLTWYSEDEILELTHWEVTLKDFFASAKINSNAKLIKWVICWCRVEDIENPLTQQLRYLDKLVDELARWKKFENILRK
jgi:hypothetical protein